MKQAFLHRGILFSRPLRTARRATSTPTAQDYQRDPELQAALDAFYNDTIHQGRRRVPNAEVRHHVERLTELGSKLGLDRVNPEWNDGAFRGLVTTMMSGITEDSKFSLGRLTFGKVQPAELMLQSGQAAAAGVPDAADQFKGPLARVAEGPSNGYSVVTYFRVLDSGLLGRMTIQGLYSIDETDPAKLHITFVGFTVDPVHSDPQTLAAWRHIFADHNPDMGPDGLIEVKLQPRPSNYLRYIVMEPDLHLAVGGSGSLTVMQRAPATTAG